MSIQQAYWRDPVTGQYVPVDYTKFYAQPTTTTTTTTTTTAPPPTGSSPTPDTPVPADQVSTVTGIDPREVAAATYGKIVPIWVGGQLRLGCHIIFGPYFRDAGGYRVCDFGVSFGMPANNIGTRVCYEVRLDGAKVWALDGGNTYNPFTFRFYPGTETQAADPLVIAAFPTAPVAHRGQCCIFMEGIRIADFNLKVPFVSALIADTTGNVDPTDGINLGDGLQQIAYSPYVALATTEFGTDGISERVDGIIVADKISFMELLTRYARLYLWDIVQTDKLKVLERGSVAPDLSLDLTSILAVDNGPPISIDRTQQPDVARELDYSYIDIDRDMEINTVVVKRPRAPVPVTASDGKDTIALPSVHTVQEALAWATLRKYFDELARETVSLTTTAYGYGIEPGDVVSVDAGFKTYIIRVLETLRGANWTNQIKGQPVLRCAFPVRSSSPLDGIAGLTGAWSLSRALLSAFGSASPRYDDVSGAVSRIYDQSGNGRNFVDGGAATRPAVVTAAPANRTAADFDGSTDYLDTGAALSNFITNSAAYVVISVIVDAVTLNDNTPQNNHCIIGDANQKFGIYARAVNELTILPVNL